jgi:alpha-glucosidase
MISNHDGKRVASRVGPEQARVAAMLQLTLRGTPIVYYGDEIGMHDVEIPPDREQDPQGKLIGRKRDPVRTPMQWNAEPQASFSTTEPWLPVAGDYEALNVDAQHEPHSMLALYRRLLALRRDEPALTAGACTLLHHDERLLAYRRDADDRALLVVLNLAAEPCTFDLGDLGDNARLVLSTALDRDNETDHGAVELRANEGVIMEL